MYNFTDAVNGSIDYNAASGFNDSAAIIVYPYQNELIIALLVIIAFCQVLQLLLRLSKEVMK